jgi:NTP pyrophosphatase (non-canonical NTP hydrolase)
MNQKEVYEWRVNNFDDPPTAIKQALVIAEESGEVCRAVLKREQHIRGTEEHWTEELKIECAQLLIGLYAMAEHEGFDLLEYTKNYWPTIASRNLRTNK